MATRVCQLLLLFPALVVFHLPTQVRGDCWLIEGDKGYVWLAICSQNQPPYETIPQHINSTVSTNSSFPLLCPIGVTTLCIKTILSFLYLPPGGQLAISIEHEGS